MGGFKCPAGLSPVLHDQKGPLPTCETPAHLSRWRSQVWTALLARSKRNLSTRLRATIVRTLIQPHIDFGVAAWGAASRKVIKPLEISLKKSLRVATNAKYNAHTNSLWEATGCLEVKAAHQAACVKVARAVITNTAPEPIRDTFPIVQSTRRSIRKMKSEENPGLDWPRTSKTYLSRLPQYQVPSVYANAPIALKSCPPEKVRQTVKRIDYQDKSKANCIDEQCYVCNRIR